MAKIETSKLHDSKKIKRYAINAMTDENGKFILMAMHFRSSKKHVVKTGELNTKEELLLEFDSMIFDIEMNTFNIHNYVMLCG